METDASKFALVGRTLVLHKQPIDPPTQPLPPLLLHTQTTARWRWLQLSSVQFYSIAKQGIMRGVLLPLKQSSYAVCLLCLLPDTELAASLLRADIRHGSLGS